MGDSQPPKGECVYDCVFGEDVPNLRFEVGIESSSEETKPVVVMLSMINS